MPRNYESREDKSGILFEHFLFGDVTSGKNTYRYMEALKRAIARSGKIKDLRDMPKDIALDLAREVQVQDPMNPTRPFMKDLRDAVIKKLGLPPAISKKIGFYSSVGTPLDFSNETGTDAFFELKTDAGELIMVALDATLDLEGKKEKGYKADLLISSLPDKNEEEKNYFIAVNKIAQQVVEIFKKRIGA